MTKIAIVILNWNGRKFLETFLPGIIQHSSMPGIEIIVADNASSDDSISFLKEHFPEVRIILLDRNYGFAGGYNRALKDVEAEYYLLLNSDIEVKEKWIEPLLDFMEQHPEVASCAPVLMDYNKKEKYEYAGAAGGYLDKYGYAFCRGRLFDTIEDASDEFSRPLSVFWTTGACMLIRSGIYDENGGFDEDFFAHMEEIDLCWRIKNQGYKLAVVPESRVYHVGGGTLPKGNPFKTFLNYRNNLYMLAKNLPDKKAGITIFKRMLLDGISALNYLRSLNFSDFQAVFKAHMAFYKKRKILKAFRKTTKNVLTHTEMYPYSVVNDYFFRGNKKFARLRGNFGEQMNDNIIL